MQEILDRIRLKLFFCKHVDYFVGTKNQTIGKYHISIPKPQCFGITEVIRKFFNLLYDIMS